MFMHFRHCLHLLQVSCSCIGELHCGHVASVWSLSSYGLASDIFEVYCLYSSPGTSSSACRYIRFIVWSAIIPLNLYSCLNVWFCNFHLAAFALSIAKYSVIIDYVEPFCWFTPHLDNLRITFVCPVDPHEGFCIWLIHFAPPAFENMCC